LLAFQADVLNAKARATVFAAIKEEFGTGDEGAFVSRPFAFAKID